MRKLFLPFVALTALLVACNDDDNCSPVTVDIHDFEARLAGDQLAISISCAGDWTITPSADWLRADVLRGTGDAEVMLTMPASTEDDERKGEYLFESGSFSDKLKVTQHGTNTSLEGKVSKEFYDVLKFTTLKETVTADDASRVESLDFSSMSSSPNLDGIRYLTSLKSFTARTYTGKEADFSQNPLMEIIDLGQARDLESIKVNNCVKLTELWIDFASGLKELELHDNTKLEVLSLEGCGVNKLDLSMCKNLKSVNALNCNSLTEIIIPGTLDTDKMEKFIVPDDTEIKISTAA